MNFFVHPQFLWGMPGGTEWVLIGLIILLFFGGRKIPDLMRGLGRGVKEFNDARGKNKNEKVDSDTAAKGSISEQAEK